MAENRDLAQIRQQVETNSRDEEEEGQSPQFEDGFGAKAIVGALFVGFIMMPGALYLGLVAGQGLGPAAVWVTIVLFAEIMRRSFLPMKKQEIYVLLRRLADSGAAIVFYTTDYAELIGCCDRALVLYDGTIRRELVGGEITERALIMSALNIADVPNGGAAEGRPS